MQEAGFCTAGGGHHVGRGTANELYRLSTGYLELLTIVDREQALAQGGSRRQAATFLDARPHGLLGYALEVSDVDATMAHLREAGVMTSGPHGMKRRQPDGHVVSWRTALIDDRQWRSPHPFLIQWDTEEEARWRGAATEHPNGVAKVAGLAVESSNLGYSTDVYQALGGKVTAQQDHSVTLALANLEVVVNEVAAPPSSPGRLTKVVLATARPDIIEPEVLAGAVGQWFDLR